MPASFTLENSNQLIHAAPCVYRSREGHMTIILTVSRKQQQQLKANNLAIASQLYFRKVESTHSYSCLCGLTQRRPHDYNSNHIKKTLKKLFQLVKNLMICIIPVILVGQSCRQKTSYWIQLLCTRNYTWNKLKCFKRVDVTHQQHCSLVKVSGPWRSNQVHYKDVVWLQGGWVENEVLQNLVDFYQ